MHAHGRREERLQRDDLGIIQKGRVCTKLGSIIPSIIWDNYSHLSCTLLVRVVVSLVQALTVTLYGDILTQHGVLERCVVWGV